MFTISFPTGGSITAVEELTFAFGEGGFVDTAAVFTGYAQGNHLVLGTGESLQFEAGGVFDLGQAGNVDYIHLAIETEGDVTIAATTNEGVIFIRNVNLSAANFYLNSDASITGNLDVIGDIAISGSGSILLLGELNITSTATLQTILEVSSGAVFSNTGNLEVQDDGAVVLTSGQIIADASLELSVINDIILNPNSNNVVGPITLEPLTAITIDGVFYSSDDGKIFTDENGTIGKLEIIAGELVFAPDTVDAEEKKTGGGGVLNVGFWLFFWFFQWVFFYRKLLLQRANRAD